MELESLLAKKSKGLKVMYVGLCIAAIGFALSWWLNIKAGNIIFLLGWLVGVYGLVVNWKAKYQLMKEKPENIYPRAKQPWER